jgi:hypothetical protein
VMGGVDIFVVASHDGLHRLHDRREHSLLSIAFAMLGHSVLLCSTFSVVRLVAVPVSLTWLFQSTRSSRLPLAWLHQRSTVVWLTRNVLATERIDLPLRTAKTICRRTVAVRVLFLTHKDCDYGKTTLWNTLF